ARRREKIPDALLGPRLRLGAAARRPGLVLALGRLGQLPALRHRLPKRRFSARRDDQRARPRRLQRRRRTRPRPRTTSTEVADDSWMKQAATCFPETRTSRLRT